MNSFRLFSEPHMLDAVDRRRAYLLNILLLGIGVLAFLALLGTFFLADRNEPGYELLIVGALITMVVAGVLYLIGRFASYRIASWLFSFFLVIIFAVSDTPDEVVNGRVLFTFTIPILMSSFLLDSYSSFIIAGFVGLLLNIITISLTNLPFSAYLVTGYFAVALVAWLAARSLEQAIQELQVTNRKLTERTAELEKTNALLNKENIERKRVETALAEQARSLTRTNAELQQLAYVATHDLREPLRKVRTYAELLERRYQGKLDQKADKYIHYVMTGAMQMHLLITDLLAYLGVGEKALRLQTIDLNQILKKVLADLELLVVENSAVITHDILPMVQADPSQMVALFRNLISNAIKFRRDDPPEIKIQAERHPDEWLFMVSDNGIGIEAEYTERIFVIFQRLHTKEQYSGTGIGLAICKKVVENHNGRIWFHSTPGQGTTFYFTLPI